MFYKRELAPLMLVTHRQNTAVEDYLPFLARCASCGIDCVQLREKNISDEQYQLIARRVLKILSAVGVPLIINDRVDVAQAVDADGVHLGQSDLSPDEARKIIGYKKIIGRSVATEQEFIAAQQEAVDYIGVGPIFPTANKEEKEAIGLDRLLDFCRKTRHPIIAIGGIHENNAGAVFRCGAMGIACINSLHQSPHLEKTIQQLRAAAKRTTD